MFPKLSKSLIIALIGATVCSAAAMVQWHENNGGETWGNANAATVCTPGQNDPQLCWNHDIQHHIFTGNPATCYGVHVTSAVQQAVTSGTIFNPQVLNSDPITGLMSMQWYDAFGQPLCHHLGKTVWNDISHYPLAPNIPHYTAQDVKNICVNTITAAQCVTPPQGIVAASGHGGKICVKVVIRNPPGNNPGVTCYPRGISVPAGNIGSPC